MTPTQETQNALLKLAAKTAADLRKMLESTDPADDDDVFVIANAAQLLAALAAQEREAQPVAIPEGLDEMKRSMLATADRVIANIPLAKKMADRFCGWNLPTNFAPDCGISFDGRKDDDWNKNKTWPTGTNLLTHAQAEAMFLYCLGGEVGQPQQVQPIDAKERGNADQA